MYISKFFSVALILILAPVLFFAANAQAREMPTTCTYETYTWNTRLKQAVEFHVVQRDYDALTAAEIDGPTGCTVCEEDQAVINIDGIEPFRVCHVIAPQVTAIFQSLVERGKAIFKIEGYRVGKTRGDTDKDGNRTRFSNHSYGIALDINSGQNGLYDRCLEFNSQCRLIRGGPWKPGRIEGSLLPDGDVVRLFKEAGFQWGGEISGRQKDFMHFSPSGY